MFRTPTSITSSSFLDTQHRIGQLGTFGSSLWQLIGAQLRRMSDKPVIQ
jgi:hypothetical protein